MESQVAFTIFPFPTSAGVAPSCTPGSDNNKIGPFGDFRYDFTLFFEQCLLSSILAFIFLVAAPPRIYFLFRQDVKIIQNSLKYVKIVCQEVAFTIMPAVDMLIDSYGHFVCPSSCLAGVLGSSYDPADRRLDSYRCLEFSCNCSTDTAFIFRTCSSEQTVDTTWRVLLILFDFRRRSCKNSVSPGGCHEACPSIFCGTLHQSCSLPG